MATLPNYVQLESPLEFTRLVCALERSPRVSFLHEHNGKKVLSVQMDLLKEKGDGYVLEIAAEVDDLDAFYDRTAAKGVTMVSIDGKPLAAGTKGATIEPTGDRHHYFPLNVSCGMRITVFERGPRDSSLFHRRDDTWLNAT